MRAILPFCCDLPLPTRDPHLMLCRQIRFYGMLALGVARKHPPRGIFRDHSSAIDRAIGQKFEGSAISGFLAMAGLFSSIQTTAVQTAF